MVNSFPECALSKLSAQDPLAVLPGYALRRAANAMMAELAGRLAPHGLRVTEASVLLLILARAAQSPGGLTSTAIGQALDIQRPNMVPLLARLEATGLIRRSPLDGKRQAITLTDAGTACAHAVEALTASFEEDLLARIPAEHRDHLLPALNALWRD